METFTKVTGFMQYEKTQKLEIGCEYKGKNNNYILVGFTQFNTLILEATRGHNRSQFTAHKYFLEVS